MKPRKKPKSKRVTPTRYITLTTEEVDHLVKLQGGDIKTYLRIKQFPHGPPHVTKRIHLAVDIAKTSKQAGSPNLTDLTGLARRSVDRSLGNLKEAGLLGDYERKKWWTRFTLPDFAILGAPDPKLDTHVQSKGSRKLDIQDPGKDPGCPVPKIHVPLTSNTGENPSESSTDDRHRSPSPSAASSLTPQQQQNGARAVLNHPRAAGDEGRPRGGSAAAALSVERVQASLEDKGIEIPIEVVGHENTGEAKLLRIKVFYKNGEDLKYATKFWIYQAGNQLIVRLMSDKLKHLKESEFDLEVLNQQREAYDPTLSMTHWLTGFDRYLSKFWLKRKIDNKPGWLISGLFLRDQQDNQNMAERNTMDITITGVVHEKE